MACLIAPEAFLNAVWLVLFGDSWVLKAQEHQTSSPNICPYHSKLYRLFFENRWLLWRYHLPAFILVAIPSAIDGIKGDYFKETVVTNSNRSNLRSSVCTDTRYNSSIGILQLILTNLTHRLYLNHRFPGNSHPARDDDTPCIWFCAIKHTLQRFKLLIILKLLSAIEVFSRWG